MSVGADRFLNRLGVLNVSVTDALEALRDHLGLSWPEFETALSRGDVKRLLDEHDAKVRLNVQMYGRVMR